MQRNALKPIFSNALNTGDEAASITIADIFEYSDAFESSGKAGG